MLSCCSLLLLGEALCSSLLWTAPFCSWLLLAASGRTCLLLIALACVWLFVTFPYGPPEPAMFLCIHLSPHASIPPHPPTGGGPPPPTRAQGARVPPRAFPAARRQRGDAAGAPQGRASRNRAARHRTPGEARGTPSQAEDAARLVKPGREIKCYLGPHPRSGVAVASQC